MMAKYTLSMSICIGVRSFSYNLINYHYSTVHYTFLYTVSSIGLDYQLDSPTNDFAR